ncbi:hypothetical protein V8E54_011153 [Elaphomyces granulatus]
MLCQQTFFIVAAFLTLSVHSLPSPPLDMGLKVIRQYEAEGGNITRYKDQSPAKRSFDTVDLSRPQCGSGNLTCSSQNTFAAYQSDCAGLLSVLSGQQPSARNFAGRVQTRRYSDKPGYTRILAQSDSKAIFRTNESYEAVYQGRGTKGVFLES